MKSQISKFNVVLLAILCAIVTASCSKMGALSSDYFTVVPNPLEATAGKVPATINGLFPEKYMKKKAIVTVTPVLRYAEGETEGQSATFQGEKVQGNNQTIAYRMGGNYTMRTNFNYIEPMRKSELYLKFDARVGKKTYKVPDVKVADGVMATSELVKRTVATATTAAAADNFQRIVKQKQEANIQFLVNQAIIRTGELKSVSVQQFLSTLKAIQADAAGKAMDGIEVSSYASPEGSLQFNTTLAQNRGKNTQEYINKELKDKGLATDINTKYTAEDWEGFQQLVSKSNIQDKEVILRVLSMYQDPEERETQIRNISAAYTDLTKEILPQLRRSRIMLNYNLIGRSDPEILQQYSDDPAKLSVEEMLYSVGLTDSKDRQQSVLQKTAEIYPNDWRAFNNLATLAYEKGDYATARQYVAKALSLNPNAPEANVNSGLLSLLDGNASAAQQALAKGSEAAALSEALGNLYLMQGNYAQAVKSFGKTASNSAALAQILTKDYLAAAKTLAGVQQPDAMTSYLKAIVAARSNNATEAATCLRQAVALDPALATLAKNDIEFAKINL
ncbi:MAG: tetratricopeptide repeat protein [Bacteroidaceae bacterium]|nr:tetratricopeptide repeat protein [Bacteroidaceae bacterium]